MEFRTDLADERTEIVRSTTNVKDIDGIISENKKINDKFDITTVKVLDENGAQKIDKKIGTYVTINIDDINLVDEIDIKKGIAICRGEINKMIKKYHSILVVGLGNEESTADAIGSKVVKNLNITRHILNYEPDLLPTGTHEISGIVPGVLGTTGIETQEIIKSIVDKIHFDAIIAIDAICSNNISRLLKTIQICDTGITPGSGVGNKRNEISLETMGIPVIAIGVPTVVEASTIVADTFDILIKNFKEFSFLADSSYADKLQLIKTVLEPSHFNLAVMPKEIDDLVDNMKEIIAQGINELI